MSHLTILPTVLHDAEVLASSLRSLGHTPLWGGEVGGFAEDRRSVVLQVSFGADGRLGWLRQPDGSLALVGDLQRLCRCHSAQRLLAQITRSYATQMALRDVAEQFGPAQISLAGPC